MNNKIIYAVIDTNVIVSALLKKGSVPDTVLRHVITGDIVPVFCDDIVAEYWNVLSRAKFGFSTNDVETVIHTISKRGIYVMPKDVMIEMPDPKDMVFYGTYLSMRGCCRQTFLITGNIKHFPNVDNVVTPRIFLNHFSDWICETDFDDL